MKLPNKSKFFLIIQLTDDYYLEYMKNSKTLMTETHKYNNLKMDKWSQ